MIQQYQTKPLQSLFVLVFIVLFHLPTYATHSSNDSLSVHTTNPIDSLQVKVTTKHLASLQQSLSLKSGVLGLGTTAKKTYIAKQSRRFASLDNTIKEEPFFIPLAQQTPEFSLENAANFMPPKNPKVEKLKEKAQAAFDEIKKLQNFAEIITGNKLLKLPVGMVKKDPTSGNKVELAITQVKFLPKYAEFNAWAKLTIPTKDNNGQKQEKELYFGAEGIKLSNDGAIIGDMKLVLLGDVAIPIKGDNWLLSLKGGVDTKTGNFADKTYVEMDCTGLKEVSLEGSLRISRNVLLPVDTEGAYTCGDSKDNQFEKDGTTVNTKCYVGSDFSIKAAGWNDVLVEVTLPRFEVRGLKGYHFNIENAILDLSDTRNSPNLSLPREYQQIFNETDQNLWRGVFAKNIEVSIPKGFTNTKTTDKRVKFGANNLVIDGYGVSGSFYSSGKVIDINDGAANKWAFSIDTLGVTLAVNSLVGGAMGGEIKTPIIKQPLKYAGYIAPKEYGLSVTLTDNLTAPLLLAKLNLKKNSSVLVKVKDGNKVYPYANLTGNLTVTGKVGQKKAEETMPDNPQASTSNSEKNKGKGFVFEGITFQELELQTEPGKPKIKAKHFGYKGESNLMNFPVTVKDLKFVSPTDNIVGLGFDLGLNLDKGGSFASTSLEVLGKLPQEEAIEKWEFYKIKVKGIEIDYEKSGFSLKGKLKVMDNDPTYGDGFKGDISATFKSLSLTANARAMFGAKDYRYWFVDIWTDNNKNSSKLLIKSFVGGLSYHMTKVSGNSDGFTPSDAVYEPDETVGLGLRAGVVVQAVNPNAFKGKAYLEMEFNTGSQGGGLRRIGFTGEGAVMGKDAGKSVAKKELSGIEKKINDFAKENPEIADQLKKHANFLGLSKKSIPKREIASQGSVGVYVGIERDFENGTFDGEFEVYINAKAIRGSQDDNLAGWAKIHTGPEDWYMYIGSPEKNRRIGLLFDLEAIELEVGGYFMTGTKLPTQIPPHPRVLQILGDDIMDGNRKSNQLEAARGFAFGLNFVYRKNFSFAIFYAFIEAGVGFDVMHAYYPNVKCKGRSGPVGNDGWYSMGQVYAYLYGEFGVEVDLFFISGKFPIVEAGIAALLRGKFPNPTYIEGYVGMYYSILGGLVSGRFRLKVEFGDECEMIGMDKSVGVPIISDVSPSDGSTKVDVFTAPQAAFNYRVNEEFRVDIDGRVRYFKLQLKEFTVNSQGEKIEGRLEWSDTKDVVTFYPAKTLPSEQQIKVAVEVSFEEKINGKYVVLTDNGKLVTEKREVTFKADKAPDHIVWNNIDYLYPVPEQSSFHPKEYNKGYVTLKQGQDYLFSSKYQVMAEFRATSGNVLRSKASYDKSKYRVTYNVPPNLDLSSEYQFDILVFPAGQDVPTKLVVEDIDISYNDEEGATSWYDPGGNSQTNSNQTASTTVKVNKLSGEKLNTALPKSILDYEFETSEHASFRDKVNSLSYKNHITNFIYANVHSMSIEVADYEYFDEPEVVGNKHTKSKPLVYGQAVLNDSYYKKQIYPLVYQKYPIEGNIKVNRDEKVLGVPPVRSFYLGMEYIRDYKIKPNSYWVKNRIPFIYNLPYQYRRDFIYLRDRVVNMCCKNEPNNTTLYNKYVDLIEKPFPAIPFGKYNAELRYRTPGGLYDKGYKIKYKND